MIYIFCFLLGCVLGIVLMGILSHGAYGKGYADALKRGDLFEQ